VTARVVFDADITPRSRTAYEPALRYRRACAPEPRRFRTLAPTTTPNPSTRPRPSLRLKCRPTRTLCIGTLTLALCRARSAARGVPAGRDVRAQLRRWAASRPQGRGPRGTVPGWSRGPPRGYFNGLPWRHVAEPSVRRRPVEQPDCPYPTCSCGQSFTGNGFRL